MPAEQDEAALGELDGALEVEDPERGPEVPVRLRLEVERRRRSPAPHLDVVVLVGAERNAGVGEVGAGEQQVARVGVDDLALGVERFDAVVDAPHLLLGGLGVFEAARLHECADGL